jgi:hypothetical protein
MRKITIHLEELDDESYAHIANAVWTLLRATGCDFQVEPDGTAERAKLDEVWDAYSDVSWRSGARRGTPQSEIARRAT